MTNCTEAAHRIGLRLLDRAIWADKRCTWTVVGIDQVDPWSRKPTFEPAGPSIYKGTAGIGLFLSELAAKTGDRRILHCANAAFQHSITCVSETAPGNLSFYSGRSGVAWALVRHGVLTGVQSFFDSALNVLRPIYGKEDRDRGLDVIGGAAGAIPALISIGQEVGAKEPLDCAIRLGSHLLNSARMNPVGWSWRSASGMSARDLTGFAHGAAGFGYALLELYSMTGEGWALHAADQAFRYESHHYDATRQNWPDFRHAALDGAFHMPKKTAELRKRLLEGQPPPYYKLQFMQAWCHGAPGIALSRLRAYEITRNPHFLKEARLALATTAEGLRLAEIRNYSLCHGVFGNAEALLAGADDLRHGEWREMVEAIAARAIDKFEAADRPWPSGCLDGLPDASLLLGDAGIGHFLLRFDSRDIPSVLLIKGAARAVPQVRTGHQGAWIVQRLVDNHRNTFFRKTIRAFEKLDRTRPSYVATSLADWPSDPFPMLLALEQRVKQEPDCKMASLLQDALLLEQFQFKKSLLLADFLRPEIASLGRSAVEDVDWDSSVFQLETDVGLLHTTVDWERWLACESDTSVPRRGDGVTFVVWPHKGTMLSRRIGKFASAVLGCLAYPQRLDEVVEQLAAFVSGPATLVARHRLGSSVRAQIQEAYQVGFIYRVSVIPESASVT